MSSTPKRFAAVLLAAALLGGACSDGGEEQAAENPEQAFTDALDAFSEYEGITLEMTLEADPQDLVEEDTTLEVAEQIVNSSVTFSGKGSTPEDIQLQMLFNVDGNEDAVEVRIVGDSIYARAEVRDLVDAFGGSDAEVDAAVEQASSMGFDFVEAAVNGEWVGVEGLYDLAEQFGMPVQTPDPDQAAELQDRLVSILENNAEVTSEGTDDVGAHLVVSVPLRETASELFDAVGSISGTAVPPLPAEDIPDGDASMDVWVSDGQLVQVELDFVALAEQLGEEAPEGVDRMALRIGIEEFTDDVEAPEDFEPIDLQQIFGSLFAGGFGSSSSGGSGAIPAPGGVAPGSDPDVVVPALGLRCDDLAGVPPEQIKAFLEGAGEAAAYDTVKKECPELF